MRLRRPAPAPHIALDAPRIMSHFGTSCTPRSMANKQANKPGQEHTQHARPYYADIAAIAYRSAQRDPPAGGPRQHCCADPDHACTLYVLRPKSYRAEELLDLPIDLPKSSSTRALFRRALRPPAQWPESSQAAARLGRGAPRPPQAPSELSGWLNAAGELSGRGRWRN